MGDGDRELGDELQAETREVAESAAEEAVENERSFSATRARASNTFPSRSSGSDGDSTVVIRGGVWYCQKVRGSWYKVRMVKA